MLSYGEFGRLPIRVWVARVGGVWVPLRERVTTMMLREGAMNELLVLQSVIAILAGLLIFAKPALLSYIVAAYLILFGIAGLAVAFS